MAKRKSPKGLTALTIGPASAKAQEKIATLRRYYELGRRASGTNLDSTTKKPEPIKDLAAEAGVGADTIRKALTFATTYNESDLSELLGIRDKRDEPLGWYLVRALLQVKDETQRGHLQKQAALEGWSRDDLRDEINALQGSIRRERKSGRKFALARNPGQALRRLVQESESWLRYYANVGSEGGIDVLLRTAAQSGKQTADLKQLIRQARFRLSEVQETSGKVAEQLRKWERNLKTEVKEVGTTPSKTVGEAQGEAQVEPPTESKD